MSDNDRDTFDDVAAQVAKIERRWGLAVSLPGVVLDASLSDMRTLASGMKAAQAVIDAKDKRIAELEEQNSSTEDAISVLEDDVKEAESR